MSYEVILLLLILAIPLLIGMALIVDALRRAIREARQARHEASRFRE
jgi:hypothetical protein